MDNILEREWISGDGSVHKYGEMNPAHLFYAARMVMKKRDEYQEQYNDLSNDMMTSDTHSSVYYSNEQIRVQDKLNKQWDLWNDLSNALIQRNICIPCSKDDVFDEVIHVIPEPEKPREPLPSELAAQPVYDIY